MVDVERQESSVWLKMGFCGELNLCVAFTLVIRCAELTVKYLVNQVGQYKVTSPDEGFVC